MVRPDFGWYWSLWVYDRVFWLSFDCFDCGHWQGLSVVDVLVVVMGGGGCPYFMSIYQSVLIVLTVGIWRVCPLLMVWRWSWGMEGGQEGGSVHSLRVFITARAIHPYFLMECCVIMRVVCSCCSVVFVFVRVVTLWDKVLLGICHSGDNLFLHCYGKVVTMGMVYPCCKPMFVIATLVRSNITLECVWLSGLSVHIYGEVCILMTGVCPCFEMSLIVRAVILHDEIENVGFPVHTVWSVYHCEDL